MPPAPKLLGAQLLRGGVDFSLWAPAARSAEVRLEQRPSRRVPMRRRGGLYTVRVAGLRAGTRYRFSLDGGGPVADPYSRFQPSGLDGPSEVVDPAGYAWRCPWSGLELESLIFYELHVGAFTRAGTWAAAEKKLDHLAALGINAIEIMPVAEFPGRRNWGYDGALLFAPSHRYGRPEAMKAFIDAAHARGMAVILDAVYNHVGIGGPDWSAFDPAYLSRRHKTAWGPHFNFDGEGSGPARALVIANALYWLKEFRLDGLRLDATHALRDESRAHVLAEMRTAVGRGVRGRRVHLIAEDTRNDPAVLRKAPRCWGMDAMWSDDFCCSLRARLAGQRGGPHRRMDGSPGELERILNGGVKAYAAPLAAGESGARLRGRIVVYAENHDQVANRPPSQRLAAALSLGQLRAAAALLFFAPQLPLIFMGEEWASQRRFHFFADHSAELAAAVAAGRRELFSRYPEWREPSVRRAAIDPNDPRAFEESRLSWGEARRGGHAAFLKFMRELIAIRKRLSPAGANGAWRALRWNGGEDLGIIRQARGGGRYLALIHWRGKAVCRLRAEFSGDWAPVLRSGGAARGRAGEPAVAFNTTGIVILRSDA